VTSSSEFLIFRDSRRSVQAADLVAGVRAALRHTALPVPPDDLIALLLRAGELETALSDGVAPLAACEQASLLTDLFADALMRYASSDRSPNGLRLASSAQPILDQIHYSLALTAGIPEGFAYYAIHPLDYADLVQRVKIDSASALVVGVRSIGATLSAVVAAKLRQMGIAAERMTVRPVGNPYDRTCQFESMQRRAIEGALAGGADFLVCDEGPGRSGSSLLSVAEAMEREGVPRSKIMVLCAYEPNVNTLCAPDAAQRWGRYRVAPAGVTRRLPADAGAYLGGGWRRKFVSANEPWPAVWPEMERLRYGSADGRTLLTFEGHGHYGAAVHDRNQALADSAFGPAHFGQEAGFGRQAVQQGTTPQANECTAELLTHMAQYCAWRAREFAVASADASTLEAMAHVNFEREFRVALEGTALPSEFPVVCDGRMMPHEWLRIPGNRWLKLDAAIHGDDHFFPGPCDIAWDLAGIVVEWELPAAAREFLLTQYRQVGGDDISLRIRPYELAYATFRMAWSRMAAGSTADREQQARLLRDYRRYRQFLQKIPEGTPPRGVVSEPTISSLLL
jgi:hypothetical protein